MSYLSSSSSILYPSSGADFEDSTLSPSSRMNTNSNSSSRSTSSSQNQHLSLSGLERRNALVFQDVQSPSMSWTPFFEGMHEMEGSGYLSKGYEMNTFSAFESLNVDDLINNEIGSSSSSTTSEVLRDPSSSLHNLPAWSTNEDGDTFRNHSDAFTDDYAKDTAINDVWFAPTATLSRKKRSKIAKGEQREVSPGVAANLKSHKSAPQLIPRIASADHRAKLEDLLVEMGWPRETTSTMESKATDGGESREGSGSQGSTAASAPRPSSGAGSLASGMPATGALFQRRAHMREGNLPSPAPVLVTRTEDLARFDGIPATSVPVATNDDRNSRSDGQLHSRSATFPLSHDAFPSIHSREGLSFGSDFPSLHRQSSMSNSNDNSLSSSFVSPNQQFAGHGNSERAAKAVEAALLYGMEPRRTSLNQQYSNSPNGLQRPDTAGSSVAMSELQTPITPFQSLHSSDGNAVPFAYQASPSGGMSNQMLSGYRTGYPSKLKTNETDGGNLLGLQDMTVLNQQQSATPIMIDSSSYSQIFAGMPHATAPKQQQQQQQQRQRRQSLKQMKSSPNMRTSPSSEGSSPAKTPLRKIASNRRLTVTTDSSANAGMNSNSFVTIPPSPMKSPSKKGKSSNLPGLPPLPTSATVPPSASAPGSFEFVNYGMDDAEELCSAVAPSGSYKVPLKGFGSGEEGEEGEERGETDEMANDQGFGRSRSRSKSNNRMGPRWQGTGEMGQGEQEDAFALQSSLQTSSQDSKTAPMRQIKRRKSEASMTSLPAKRKTASSGNLKKRD